MPFADASPARVRAALTPDDAAEFDRQWHDVMTRATERFDLTEVMETLDSWRRVAWVTTSTGPRACQEAPAGADERLRTGERHPGAVPWSRLEA